MNSRVAVIICNWNKKDDVLRCIESVNKSTYKYLDIYVVDNASTDDSVEVIKSLTYPLTLIQNERNLGGSGGFNAGLRTVFNKEYDYVMLLDNDVVLDTHAIQVLVETMDSDNSIGILGSKLYVLEETHQTNKLQEYGSYIDWETFNIKVLHKGEIDTNNLPELIKCDYVPACSMMIRMEALRRVGLFEEHYFIYWDDMEFGYLMNLHGYKVMACSKSKAWHKQGVKTHSTTFSNYYFWRNRIHFFIKYIPLERIEQLAETLFRELYQVIYFSQFKGQMATINTILFAFSDALHHITGSANEGRILDKEKSANKVVSWISDNRVNSLLIIDHGVNLVFLENVIRDFEKHGIKIILQTKENKLDILNRYPTIIVFNEGEEIVTKVDKTIKICEHILDIRDEVMVSQIDLYIDQYSNLIVTNFDRKYIDNYEQSFKLSSTWAIPYIKAQLLKAKQLITKGQ
ncbi:glycosyltransferase family 2 protein [Paenibacillus dendritiformis]|uniref:glycosyltransferase family 2 protein n=1 Tax=Paenibacillus dendritiformis TaxID=130049 RepID=UPI00365F5A28